MGRSLRPPCNEKCRKQCWKKIDHSERQRIFDEYYSLADKHLQWQYLGRNMDKTVPKLRSISDPPVYKRKAVVERQRMRRNNLQYYLQTETEKVKVCKTMFLATFGISEGVAWTVFQKTDDQGVLVKRDGRGSRRAKQENENHQHKEDSCSSSGNVDRENFNCTTSSS